ncbi:Uma2 family endonuclease [Burkholderia cenocepacia]|uniref:Uma2 family endonuclease n=1 Tax=Burkholderia cenocepacia TaxID=95486 RepID=UPI00076178AB|nr:Uma2 family endonuclease [Burkholderia cenocepacia]KWU26419.1 hypothetical protein AS149_25870 [Burkholderia cenocepacia]
MEAVLAEADKLGTSELLQRWYALENGDIEIDCIGYELNERGEIVWTPGLTGKSAEVGRLLAAQLTGTLGGRAVQSVPVITPDFGIRVFDVSWMPAEKWKDLVVGEPLPAVPDVCVFRVLPTSSSLDAEMRIRACLAGGAREVAVVGLTGDVQYFGPKGLLNESALGLTLNVGT